MKNISTIIIVIIGIALITFVLVADREKTPTTPISNEINNQEKPERISVSGFWECLPHKDTSGPQTMECAFGIAVDQSDAHYALDLSLLSSGPIDFPTGTHIRINGLSVPQNEQNKSAWEKYPIDGIIAVTSVEKIED